jgi:hypothetical protein
MANVSTITDATETPSTDALAPAPLASAPPDLLSRVERWAPLAAGLLLVLPLLLSAYPPMTDLPLHETTVSLLRHFGDESMYPPGLYFRNLGHPNQLFHIAAFLLSFAVGTTTACKIVIACAVVGIPVAAARFASYIGASRWTALVVAPVAVGWLFFMGLVANLIGLALLLAFFPTLDRFMKKPTVRGAAWAIAGSVAMYFAHEAMMFLYAAAALLFTLGHPLRLRATAVRLSVFVASVLITLAQLAYQAPLFTKSVKAIPTVFLPVWMKFTGMPGVLFGGYDHAESRVLFAMTLLVMIALGVQRWREHAASGDALPRGLVTFGHAYRFELFAACCFAAYVGYPVTLNGATFVYHRFLPPAFVVAAIGVSPRAQRTAPAPRLYRLTPLLAAVIPVASLFIVWPAFADSSRNHRDLEKLIPLVAKGSAVAAIAGNAPGQNFGFVKPTMAIRAVTERGGRMMYSFSESPIAAVMIHREYQWPEPIERIAANENLFCPAHDFTRFKYLLFHTTDPRLEYMVAQALKPEAKLVDVAGEWALFESTLDVVPLKSPDVAAPSPCPNGPLGRRLEKVAAVMRLQLQEAQKQEQAK